MTRTLNDLASLLILVGAALLVLVMTLGTTPLSQVKCRDGFTAIDSAVVFGVSGRPVCVVGYKP